MLPDFPNYKADIRKWAVQQCKDAITAGTPFLRDLRRAGQHEGCHSSYEDEQGNIKKMRYKRMQSELFIRGDEIPATTLTDIRNRMLKVAEDMSRQQMQMLFETMNQVTAETGNVVDGKGKPLTPEYFLNVMEKIEMGFDDHGQPQLPAIICGPKLVDQMKMVIEQIQADPGHKRRYDEIISMKREAWRDRESRRKLVD